MFPKTKFLLSVLVTSSSVEAQVKENSDYVDKVSVSCGEFEAEMVAWRKVIFEVACEVYSQKCGANDDMKPVKAGSDEEDRAVDAVSNREGGVFVFLQLNICKG